MELRDIAAFGGLALGIINLGVTLYKEFGRKGKLEVIESDFILRSVDRTLYDFQLDLRLRAKNESVYIKDIFLQNEQCFTGNVIDNKTNVKLRIPLPFKRIELRDKKAEDFKTACEEAIKKVDERITDFKIEKEANKSLSFIDRLTKPRETDGWEEFPRNGWSIKIQYNKTEIIIPLTATVV